MDPLTFELILAGAAMGLQAMNALSARRADMTTEQQAQSDALIAKFQGRITAAQQMVAPYLKETAKTDGPAGSAAEPAGGGRS